MKNIAIILLTFVTFHIYAQADKETYSIYSLIINEELKSDSLPHSKVIIQSKTSSQHAAASIEAVCGFVKLDQPIFCNYPGNVNEVIEKSPEIKNLLLDLNKDREKKVLLMNNFIVNTPYQLIDPKDYFARFKKGADAAWQQLKTENPELFGVVEFSSVVFNGDYAAVYFGYQRDAFHGAGSIIILKKEGGQWKIISSPEIWVS